MRAKILRQNLQQTVLGLLKVNVELLLLFLGIEVKKWAPGQTPPLRQRVQNFERLMSQQGAGGSEGVPQLDHPSPPAHGARRRGRVIEFADFQCIVAACSLLDTFARGVLERNVPGKFGREMQARQCQSNDVRAHNVS